MRDPQALRNQAVQAERLARDMTNAVEKAQLLKIARDWRRMAADAEARSRPDESRRIEKDRPEA